MKTKLLLSLSVLAVAAMAQQKLTRSITNDPGEIAVGVITGLSAYNSTNHGITNIVGGMTYMTNSNKPDDLAQYSIRDMTRNGYLTNVVNQLAADGTICQVRGHAWTLHDRVTLEFVPTRTSCRICAICGLHQNKYSEYK